MRPTERSQAIAFLLSCGAIPLGCPAADDADDTNATTPGTTNPSTTAGTDGTDSDASVSTTNGTTLSTTDGTTASTTLSTTDPTDPSVGTDPDTGYGTYGSSGGYATCKIDTVPAVCTTYAAHLVKCYPKYAGYMDYLEQQCACAVGYYGPMYGAGCAAAFEDFYACLNGLACDAMTKDACPTESAAVDMACDFGAESGGSSG